MVNNIKDRLSTKMYEKSTHKYVICIASVNISNLMLDIATPQMVLSIFHLDLFSINIFTLKIGSHLWAKSVSRSGSMLSYYVNWFLLWISPAIFVVLMIPCNYHLMILLLYQYFTFQCEDVCDILCFVWLHLDKAYSQHISCYSFHQKWLLKLS